MSCIVIVNLHQPAEKPYTKHINPDNPLGMKGALAKSYGDLLENMWSGDNSYLVPYKLKMMLDEHVPEFADTQQQDVIQFLNFLLHGLHEELSLVIENSHSMKVEVKIDTVIPSVYHNPYVIKLMQHSIKK